MGTANQPMVHYSLTALPGSPPPQRPLPLVRSCSGDTRSCQSVQRLNPGTFTLALAYGFGTLIWRPSSPVFEALRFAAPPGPWLGRAPPLHGGGQGFESPRLHSKKCLFAGEIQGTKGGTRPTRSHCAATVQQREGELR